MQTITQWRDHLVMFFSIGLMATALCFPSTTYASHAMGVDISYTHLGNNVYRFEVNRYRDCDGINYSTPSLSFSNTGGCTTPIGIGNWVTSITDVTPLCPGEVSRCSGGSVNGVEQWTSYRDYDFGSNNCNYKVIYSICCRNSDISSLVFPNSNPLYTNSLTLDAGLTAKNSSPEFSNIPVAYICQGQVFNYNQGATDPDGDVLVYSLGTCYEGNNDPVDYAGGYGPLAPLGPSWGVSINSVTGDISFSPSPGNIEVGVMCVLVEEYRNGIKIGETVRDIQIQTINCAANTNPVLAASIAQGGTGTTFDIKTCVGTNLLIDMIANDPDPGQTQTMSWNQNIAGASFYDPINPMIQDVISGSNPFARFDWTPTTPGNYTFLITTIDDNCPIPGFEQRTFEIEVLATPAVTITADYCNEDGSVDLTAVSAGAASYAWSNGSTTANTNIQGAGVYSVEVVNFSGCVGTATINIGCDEVVNGNFEGGNTGFSSDYTYNPSPIPACPGCLDANEIIVAQDASTTHPFFKGTDHTSGSGLFLMANGSTTPGQAVWRQMLAVTPNTNYEFSAWLSNLVVGSPGLLDFRINGISVGSQLAPATQFIWEPFSAQWFSGGNAMVMLEIVELTLASGGNDIGLDDISFASCPPGPLSSSATVMSDYNGFGVRCAGECSGDLRAQGFGGQPPYSYSWTGPDGFTDNNALILGACEGDYMVVVTDANGCDDTSEVSLSAPPELVAEAGDNDRVYFGYPDSACAQLAGSASGGVAPYSYSWSDGTLDDSTVVCPSSTTVYYLTVTDANGCTATDSLLICVTDVTCGKGPNHKVEVCHHSAKKTHTICISINAVAQHLALHGDHLGACGNDAGCEWPSQSKSITQPAEVYRYEVYPNPFNQMLKVSFTAQRDGDLRVELCSLNGQLLKSLFAAEVRSGESHQLQLDGSAYAEGVYLIRMIGSEGVSVKKVSLIR